MKSLPILLVLAALAWNGVALAQPVAPLSREQITLSFAPVVKRVVPAVVNIYTRHVEKVAISPLMSDPLFRQFLANEGYGGLPRERVVHSLGSGVVVGEDGTIVTSFHVVKGSDQITVILYDRREYEGHVVKADERSDIAVLQVDTKGRRLPTLMLRDSDTLEVGDLVLAVGNPFGVGQTVTSGIISALARSAAGISDYQFFIQTDAAINPGNSGGALVDMQGRLIGINTAIYSRTGGYQGIGFAIPANMVKAVLNGKASKSGVLIRPWFGVDVQQVTREIANAQGLDVPRGVLVDRVAAGSPAEQAGFRAGDVILTLGGGEINDPQGLNFRIATTGIGNPTSATVWRGGHEVALPVTFVVMPASLQPKPVTLSGSHPMRGAMVAPLTPEITERLGIGRQNVERVVVLRGNGLGIEAGDILLTINGQDVHSVADLQRALALGQEEFRVTLVRGGSVLSLAVSQ